MEAQSLLSGQFAATRRRLNDDFVSSPGRLRSGSVVALGWLLSTSVWTPGGSAVDPCTYMRWLLSNVAEAQRRLLGGTLMVF